MQNGKYTFETKCKIKKLLVHQITDTKWPACICFCIIVISENSVFFICVIFNV